MFEISTSQIKNCVRDLEEQERQLQNLIQRMEHLCAGFTGLARDKSDKRALQAYLEQMQKDKQELGRLRQTLSDIVMCYDETERKLAGGRVLSGVNNQFRMMDFSDVSALLDGMGISFK